MLQVAPDPYLGFHSCDYSLHPAFVGRRVEARVSDREVIAIVLDGSTSISTPRVGYTAASAEAATSR